MKSDPVIIDIAPSASSNRSRSVHARARRAPRKPVPTILLVDEDLPVRNALQRTFRSNGWRVECAANPEAALVLLTDTVPDLLITELSSGTVSGWDLLFHETLERPTLPIIVISALPAGAVYGADQFAREYFQKPLDMERLVKSVRRHIEETAIVWIT